jgi:hypothetical protein
MVSSSALNGVTGLTLDGAILQVPAQQPSQEAMPFTPQLTLDGVVLSGPVAPQPATPCAESDMRSDSESDRAVPLESDDEDVSQVDEDGDVQMLPEGDAQGEPDAGVHVEDGDVQMPPEGDAQGEPDAGVHVEGGAQAPADGEPDAGVHVEGGAQAPADGEPDAGVHVEGAPPAEDVQAAFDGLFANMPRAEEGTDFNGILDALEEELRSDDGEERRVPGAEAVRVAANSPALQMVPLPASLHPRRGREPDDEPHPEAASSRGPDLIEEPGEEPPPSASEPEYTVLDSFVDGGDTTQVVHGPARFLYKAPLEGVDIMQDLGSKDSNGRAFWVIGCVTEGAVLDRLVGADDETARAVLD